MSDSQIQAGRWILCLVWLFGVVSFLLPDGSNLRLAGQVVFWALLISHAIECPFYWRMLRATGKPMAGQIAQVILFGVLHYQVMKKELAAR